MFLALQGILNVSKPAGISSYDVIRHIKKVLKAPLHTPYPSLKIGHAGTLDPFAEGVLLILFGRATKAAEKLMSLEKSYRGIILLGLETDSGDITGKQIKKGESPIAEESLREAAARFIGKIQQVPPMYSALRHKGERLYRLARKGIALDLPAREVEIKEFRILSYDYPRAHFFCRVGRGAYIRSLAVDLGRALGQGACLESLCRSAVGPFSTENAISLEALKSLEDIEKNLSRELFVE